MDGKRWGRAGDQGDPSPLPIPFLSRRYPRSPSAEQAMETGQIIPQVLPLQGSWIPIHPHIVGIRHPTCQDREIPYIG